MALTGIIFALVPIALQFGMFLGFLARILETLVELDPGQANPRRPARRRLHSSRLALTVGQVGGLTHQA